MRFAKYLVYGVAMLALSAGYMGYTWRLVSVASAAPVRPEPAPPMALYATPRPVPNIRFQNADGRTLNLADFRGKVLLVNLWATWCTPCREEMPTLDQLQAHLGGPEFQVLAISQDVAGADAVKAFFRKIGIRHLNLYVDKTGHSAEQLGVFGIPTTVLIDRKGQALGRRAGAADWDSPAVIALIRRVVGTPQRSVTH